MSAWGFSRVLYRYALKDTLVYARGSNMAEIAQDFRIALRQLRRSPGFALTAILTLALGIGANTAIFSALNAMLLKMLPVRDPQQIYTVLLVNGGTQPPNTSGTGH